MLSYNKIFRRIMMKIAIDCDDAAIDFKDKIYDYLKGAGYDITDLKYSTAHECDYPDIAFNLAETIKEGQFDRGFLFCGTGLGVAMMANKVPCVLPALAMMFFLQNALPKAMMPMY